MDSAKLPLLILAVECTSYSSLTSGDRKTAYIRHTFRLVSFPRLGAAGTRMPTWCPPKQGATLMHQANALQQLPAKSQERPAFTGIQTVVNVPPTLKWETAALSMFTASVVHRDVAYATAAVTNVFLYKSWLLPVLPDYFLVLNIIFITFLSNNITCNNDPIVWERWIIALTLVLVGCCYGYIREYYRNNILAVNSL